MKKIIIGIAFCTVAVGGICVFSPTIKYTLAGNVKKIENAVQLNNAIEILEAKNAEMQNKFVEISSGIVEAKRQKNVMQNLADKTKFKTGAVNEQKHFIYTNGVVKLELALNKMHKVKNEIKNGIVAHHSQIELLKAKLTYLESLKTLNNYLKDVKIDGEFGVGINSIVEQAIAEEEAVSESLSELNELKSEIENL